MRIAAWTVLAAVLAGACGSRTGLFVPESLATPDTCTLPDETSILDLVNDTTLSASDYVSECAMTKAQADAIVSHRAFANARELSSVVPGIDDAFCDDLVQCAKNHEQDVCTPGNHPVVILELVVDESGSMTGEKWDALRDSLLALFDDIANDDDSQLRIGLVMFDDAVRTPVSPKPLTQAGQLDNLRHAIDKPDPHGGGTATHDALQAAVDVLEGVTGSVRRVLVLLSDGSPTGGNDEKRDCEKLVSVHHAEDGISTFAVGIGQFPSDSTALYDPAFMGRLAVAGGTAPDGCEPESLDESNICHYQVTPGGDPGRLEQSLGAALDAIRQSATTCP
jgi:uncharacterized protein YegL